MVSQVEMLKQLQEALLAGRLERGIALASSMAKEPDESLWIQGQMHLALAQLDMDRATKLAKSLALHPDADAAQRCQAAWHLVHAGERQWAEALLRDVMAKNPNSPDALEMIGLLLIEADRHSEASSMIDRLEDSAPNGPVALKLKQYSMSRQGRKEEALDVARQLSGSRDRAAVESAFSTLLRYADARESFEFLSKNRKVFGNAYWIQRARYCLKYEPDRVVWCLKHCSEKTAKSNPAFYTIIATPLAAAKLWALMEEPLIEALRLDASNARALRLLTRAYEALGRISEAKAIVERYPNLFSESESWIELRNRLLNEK